MSVTAPIIEMDMNCRRCRLVVVVAVVAAGDETITIKTGADRERVQEVAAMEVAEVGTEVTVPSLTLPRGQTQNRKPFCKRQHGQKVKCMRM